MSKLVSRALPNAAMAIRLFRTELTATGRPVLMAGEVERGMLDKARQAALGQLFEWWCSCSRSAGQVLWHCSTVLAPASVKRLHSWSCKGLFSIIIGRPFSAAAFALSLFLPPAGGHGVSWVWGRG